MECNFLVGKIDVKCNYFLGTHKWIVIFFWEKRTGVLKKNWNTEVKCDFLSWEIRSGVQLSCWEHRNRGQLSCWEFKFIVGNPEVKCNCDCEVLLSWEHRRGV